MNSEEEIEKFLEDAAQAEHEFEYSYNNFPSVLYCPICGYRIELEARDEIGSEEFCQNCLAWSIIDNKDNTFFLKFMKYDSRDKQNVN